MGICELYLTELKRRKNMKREKLKGSAEYFVYKFRILMKSGILFVAAWAIFALAYNVSIPFLFRSTVLFGLGAVFFYKGLKIFIFHIAVPEEQRFEAFLKYRGTV